jgi:hypothetical protein
VLPPLGAAVGAGVCLTSQNPNDASHRHVLTALHPGSSNKSKQLGGTTVVAPVVLLPPPLGAPVGAGDARTSQNPDSSHRHVLTALQLPTSKKSKQLGGTTVVAPVVLPPLGAAVGEAVVGADVVGASSRTSQNPDASFGWSHWHVLTALQLPASRKPKQLGGS